MHRKNVVYCRQYANFILFLKSYANINFTLTIWMQKTKIKYSFSILDISHTEKHSHIRLFFVLKTFFHRFVIDFMQRSVKELLHFQGFYINTFSKNKIFIPFVYSMQRSDEKKAARFIWDSSNNICLLCVFLFTYIKYLQT